MDRFRELNDRMLQISQIINEIKEERYVVLFRFLQERIENPENFVALLGETSSGKTTLVNGLLQEQLLPTSARPTTGTVIELMDRCDVSSCDYYAVNKDATLESITRQIFQQLSKQPDKDLERLRAVIPKFPYGLKNLRLFDTPGYGSLHEKHEQILKEFIPNSDIIIYVVSYRIGFKENDHYFMKFIEEIIDESTVFYLVINRVPEGVNNNDNRIKEIQQHAEDCLHRNLNCYLVHAEITEDRGNVILPRASDLWKDLKEELDSPERMQALFRAFQHYQKDLILDIKSHQQQQLAAAMASAEDIRELQMSLNEFLKNEEIIKRKIKDTFARLNSHLEKLFDNAMKNINDSLIAEIEKANRWTSKDECVGFIQYHLLPMQVRKETKAIIDYLQIEIEQLDEEIDSLLNTAMRKLENQITLKESIFKEFVFQFSNRMGQKMLGNSLTQFFKQFGGAGGAGAGVANAAKKGLKTIGNLFNKTFTRETHNALAKFLSRIGATSTKAIASAAAVIVEGVFYLYDVYQWPKELGKQVKKGTLEWKQETLEKVSKDMKELEESNYQSITAFFEEYRQINMIKSGDSVDIEMLKDRIERIDELLNAINEEEYMYGQ